MKQLATAVLIAGLAAVPALAQDVVPAGTTDAVPGPAGNFTGQVVVHPLTRPTAPGQAGSGLVDFEPGARSNWHTHPAGQILYVIQGCGWTQVEGGPVTRICTGDTVYAEPGIKHWHGATASMPMSHLAVTETVDGKNVNWLEPVTAAEYNGPER